VVDNINKKYYPAIVQLVNYLQNQDDWWIDPSSEFRTARAH
jgi:hypothetical protein